MEEGTQSTGVVITERSAIFLRAVKEDFTERMVFNQRQKERQ